MLDPLDPRTLQPAREAAGLTRAELAERAGVSETTILRVEKGSVDPKLDGTWKPLVRALGGSGRNNIAHDRQDATESGSTSSGKVTQVSAEVAA